MNIATVILAAGYGTRMKSDYPKVIHPVAGRPMVEWGVRTAEQLGDRQPVVVVGHGKEQVQRILGERVAYAEQVQLLGTGHAVMQAESILSGQSDAVVVFYADMPLLQSETLRKLTDRFVAESQRGNLAFTMLTMMRADSQGFGRVVRNEQGEIQTIVEEADCTPEQLSLQELNPGVYCFDATWLWANIHKLPLSRKGEYYLTDVVSIAVSQGKHVVTVEAPPDDLNGINTRVHLAQATAVMRHRIAGRYR